MISWCVSLVQDTRGEVSVFGTTYSVPDSIPHGIALRRGFPIQTVSLRVIFAERDPLPPSSNDAFGHGAVTIFLAAVFRP